MSERVLKDVFAGYKAQAEQELMRLLDWWRTYAYLPETDTYAGEVDAENKALPDAPLHCVLTARYLWGFSAAARHTKDPFWLEQADKIYKMYLNLFKDKEYGGAYWVVKPDGTVVDDHKQMYGNAFWLYGLSEYVLAGGPEEALQEAIAIFELMCKYTRDEKYGGIIEGVRRDWSYEEIIPLSAGVPVSAKSMNTSLHVLEAFTNLLRVWDTPKSRDMTREMLNVFLDHITTPQGYFRLYFEMDYTPLPDEVSFGHDIEGCWLLWEAAEVLGEAEMLKKARPYCEALCENPFRKGLDARGGLTYEAEVDGTPKVTHKVWWSQAEACVGLLNGYMLTGNEEYLLGSLRAWDYTAEQFFDMEKGEWFNQVTADDIPDSDKGKCHGWKAPYHNIRACMEISRRCDELTEKLGQE